MLLSQKCVVPTHSLVLQVGKYGVKCGVSGAIWILNGPLCCKLLPSASDPWWPRLRVYQVDPHAVIVSPWLWDEGARKRSPWGANGFCGWRLRAWTRTTDFGRFDNMSSINTIWQLPFSVLWPGKNLALLPHWTYKLSSSWILGIRILALFLRQLTASHLGFHILGREIYDVTVQVWYVHMCTLIHVWVSHPGLLVGLYLHYRLLVSLRHVSWANFLSCRSSHNLWRATVQLFTLMLSPPQLERYYQVRVLGWSFRILFLAQKLTNNTLIDMIYILIAPPYFTRQRAFSLNIYHGEYFFQSHYQVIKCFVRYILLKGRYIHSCFTSRSMI